MIELALIGKGKWGSRYLEAIKNIPDAEIKYVATRNYRDLIVEPDIDGIIIATPDSTHAEIAKTFPDKFLLIEKPFTTSLTDALEIGNPKVMAGHIYLYNLALMDQLEKARHIKNFSFRLRNTEAPEGTTPLWYLAPHGIALCVYLFGEPALVEAWEDGLKLFIKLSYQETTCFIEVGSDYPTKGREIIAMGDGIVYFDDNNKQEITPLENELRTFVNFIKGKQCPTGVDHAISVTKVLSEVENKLKHG